MKGAVGNMSGVDARFPRNFGPFVLVTPLIERDGVSLVPALRRRGQDPEPCLVTHLRLGGKHAGALERRFRRAGEIARRLDHPAIAETLTVGRLDDQVYVAHAYLAGIPLASLQPGALDVPTIVHIAREICAALAHLHAFEDRGLVHHGVSPVNVLLGYDGQVKLLECGLATATIGDSAESPRAFRGQARFTSPEAKAGEAGDRRSDIYAVGALLWDLLGPGTERVAAGANKTTSRGPAALFAVIARAMSLDPTRRHASANELRAELGPFAPGRFFGRRALRKQLQTGLDVASARRRLSDEFAHARRVLPRGLEAPPRKAAQYTQSLGHAAGLVALIGFGLAAERGFSPMGCTGENQGVPTLAVDRAPRSEAVATDPVRTPANEPALPAPQQAPPLGGTITPPGSESAHAPVDSVRPSTPGRAERDKRQERRSKAEITARAFDALRTAEQRFQWGDLDGAEAFARTATRNLAKSARAFYLLGVVLLAKGEDRAAKTAFERALTIDPSYADADAKLRLAKERATLTNRR